MLRVRGVTRKFKKTGASGVVVVIITTTTFVISLDAATSGVPTHFMVDCTMGAVLSIAHATTTTIRRGRRGSRRLTNAQFIAITTAADGGGSAPSEGIKAQTPASSTARIKRRDKRVSERLVTHSETGFHRNRGGRTCDRTRRSVKVPSFSDRRNCAHKDLFYRRCRRFTRLPQQRPQSRQVRSPRQNARDGAN